MILKTIFLQTMYFDAYDMDSLGRSRTFVGATVNGATISNKNLRTAEIGTKYGFSSQKVRFIHRRF